MGQRVLPQSDQLRKYIEEDGLSYAEIAKLITKETGQSVSRSAVGVAAMRAGLSSRKPRTGSLVPDGVRPEHANDYAARMLRLETRLRRDLPLKEDEARRLAKWKTVLAQKGVVAAYHRCDDPECATQGWRYVPAEPGEDLVAKVA
jgi:hypothetical protein